MRHHYLEQKNRKIPKYQKNKHNIYFGYRNLISSQQGLKTRQDSLPNKQESRHTPPPPPPSSSEYNPICLAPKEQETQIQTSNRTNTFGTKKQNSSLLIVWGAQLQIHNFKRTNTNKKRNKYFSSLLIVWGAPPVASVGRGHSTKLFPTRSSRENFSDGNMWKYYQINYLYVLFWNCIAIFYAKCKKNFFKELSISVMKYYALYFCCYYHLLNFFKKKFGSR